MTASLPLADAAGGVRLAVRVVPRSSAQRIIGLVADPDGASALKVALHAAPEDGKANEALLRFLAETLGLKRRDLSLALGAKERKKLVHIGGDPARLRPLIEEALGPWLRN
jgi:uncharacterized protein